MEFKESYFITSDGVRIFYRYRLASDVACENPGADEVNFGKDCKFDESNLSKKGEKWSLKRAIL